MKETTDVYSSYVSHSATPNCEGHEIDFHHRLELEITLEQLSWRF